MLKLYSMNVETYCDDHTEEQLNTFKNNAAAVLLFGRERGKVKTIQYEVEAEDADFHRMLLLLRDSYLNRWSGRREMVRIHGRYKNKRFDGNNGGADGRDR